MADSDWDQVTYLRKKAPKSGHLKSDQAIRAAQKQGLSIETNKKYSAGQNKQHSAHKDTAILDRETEELRHEHVDRSVAQIIQQARQKVNMTQKDLSTKINEKPQVIMEYEAGRAIPNQQVLGKLERALGVKLRGKDKGQPLTFKKK